MNYYEHHLGDYAEATAHLSFLEDAAYSRMLRKVYATEQPLPADVKQVQRLVGARTKEERDAVQVVLDEFWHLQDDGWHNSRADEEISRYKAAEPERAVKRRNEDMRVKRHREERARLFTDLNTHGVHPAWNVSIAELRSLHERTCNRSCVVSGAVTCNAPVTASVMPATALQTPLPTSHFPVPSKSQSSSPETLHAHQPSVGRSLPLGHTQRAGQVRKKSGKRIPEGLSLEHLRAWALEHAPTVDFDQAVAELRLHEFPKPQSDWDSTAMTWLTRAVRFQANGSTAMRKDDHPPPSAEEQDTELVRQGIAEGLTDAQLWDRLDRMRDANWIAAKRLEVSCEQR